MNPADWVRFPARPPGIAEWEEALLRMDIAARALRIPLDGGAGASAAAAGLLRERVRAERETGALLLAMADGHETARPADAPAPAADGERTVVDWLRDFERLRSRNFAMLQRRGLEVWEWHVRPGGGDGPRVSAYQLVLGVLAEDAALLQALRAAAGAPEGTC